MDVGLSDIGQNKLTKYAGAQAIVDGSTLWDADDGGAFGSAHNTIGVSDTGSTRLRMTNNGTLAGVGGVTTLADGTIARMRLGSFGFTGNIPGGANILTVTITADRAFLRILFTDNTFTICSGFTTTGAMNSKARAVLGGTPLTEHSASESNAVIISGNCASYLNELTSRDYTITGDHSWAPSDFDDSNFNVDVGASYSSSGNRMIEAFWDSVSVTVAYGETVGDINATSATRQTLRTDAITLNDGHRYLSYRPFVSGNNAVFVQSWLLIQVGTP